MSKSEDLQFDVRLLAHRTRRGEITEEQYQKYLDSLEDVAEHGVPTETRFTASFAQRGDESSESE